MRAARLKALFASAGWKVFEAKYGSRLEAAMRGPGGDALRRRIDEMSNEEYQALIRLRDGAELRRRLADVPDATDAQDDPALGRRACRTRSWAAIVSNLAGHDLPRLIEVLAEADAVEDAPVVVFAYTIKGFGLPLAGDPLNHSHLLTQTQMDELRVAPGCPRGRHLGRVPARFAGGSLVRGTGRGVLRAADGRSRRRCRPRPFRSSLGATHPAVTSTQEAMGRALVRLAEAPEVGERVVTLSPDVATSTHLAGWINKVGVFAPEAAADYEEGAQRMLRWLPGPEGRHIELGISEMNLFMALGQFGLSYELTGQHLIPIGTVYDPFVCRGLDALIYSLYGGAKMIFAGTPSGVSLSPEGGAHQSTVTPSLGIELPGLDFYEPAFAREVEWALLEALRQCCDREHGLSTYFRLSTKPIDQKLMDEAARPARRGRAAATDAPRRLPHRRPARRRARSPRPRHGADRRRRHHGAGGDRGGAPAARGGRGRQRHQRHQRAPPLPHAARGPRPARSPTPAATADLGHLATLIPADERRAPIVTVQDGASHGLAFLGSVYGAPTVPLGMDEWGQSGSRAELYDYAGIDVDEIVNAAMLALELNEE